MEESVSLDTSIRETFSILKPDVRAFSPLTLAYIGDAIFDLIIRTAVVERANRSANALHGTTIQYVKAQTQASMSDALMDIFTEDEITVYKRGRNAKTAHTAKNASIGDYHKATGLEAVFGFLYLNQDMNRLLFLVKEGLARINMTL